MSFEEQSTLKIIKDKPKLLYAIDPPLRITGGVSVLTQALIKEFSKKYQIYLLSSDSPEFLTSCEIGSYLAGQFEWSPPGGPPRLKYLKYSEKLADQIAKQKITLAHFHSGFYNFGNRFLGFSLPRLLRRRGIRSVWTTHSTVPPLLNGYCGPQRRQWMKILLFPSGWLGKLCQIKNVEYEILVSQRDMLRMQKIWFPLKSKCKQIYHSTIDEMNLGQETDHKTILNVGYISFIKRQDLIVQAFLGISDRYPDWELYFAGHDTNDGCRQIIDQLIANSPNGNKIHFLGSRNDIGSLIQKCGIYVTASDFEGLPLAPQEAMHYGRPVLTSDIPAHKELLESPGSGILFRQNDSADLATKLDSLIQDSSLRKALGRQAKASVVDRGMTKVAMLEKHSLLYQKILTNSL
jgi:glycosyltransferase involved in cell wall biosynthesis